MKLNHLNLTVTDPLETQKFLQKYFDLQPMGKANNKMAFLSDDNGMVVGLFHPGQEAEVKYPGSFHIGFIEETDQQDNEINRGLKEGRFEVPTPPRRH